MKRFAVLFGLVLPAVAILSCKSSPPPSPAPAVPVFGSNSSRAKLAGRWEGEYHSAATGRSGTIVFEFSKGEVGYGDVLMMPRGSSEPLRAARAEPPAKPESQEKAKSAAVDETLRRMQVLKIRLIETSEEALTGVLDSYIDPGCDCEVQTSFSGVIRGDLIHGSFTSKPVAGSGPETTGRWSVKRR